MGYRSTFVSSESHIQLPSWFVNKYSNTVNVREAYDENEELYYTLPISSKHEGKMYGMYGMLLQDLQRVLDEQPIGYSRQMALMVLHEDLLHDLHVLTSSKLIMTVYPTTI